MEKAWVGEHQRKHQCEALPCPWQLRLRKAQQLMHHRAVSQRHMLQKVGQNKESSGNFQLIFSSIKWTITTRKWDLPCIKPVKDIFFYQLLSCISNCTTGSDYMNWNSHNCIDEYAHNIDTWKLSRKTVVSGEALPESLEEAANRNIICQPSDITQDIGLYQPKAWALLSTPEITKIP